MENHLLTRVRSYFLLLTVVCLTWSASWAQQGQLKIQSDNPNAQQVSKHNNLRKLSKINDQQANGGENKPASVGDDAQLRRLYEIEILRDPATGKIPEAIREKELLFAEQMNARIGKALRKQGRVIDDWRARGPYNVGGRTRALALDMDNENIILAGGVSGGMWRSEDGGLTWQKTTGSSDLHSVTAVVQDPRPGQHHVWYYATGERIGNSASVGGAFYAGNGIFKSTDGGRSWSLLPASADNLPHVHAPLDLIFNLAIHPATGDLYAATWIGIHRSRDGGASFEIALAGYPDNWTDVMITPGGVIYVTFESFGDATSNRGIYRSTDGTTWTNITPAGFPTTFGRTVLGYTPSNENIVYVFANNTSNSQGYLWRYTHDNTSPSWANLTANLPNFGGSVGNLNTQGGYNMFVKVHPTNPNAVFIGATNLYRSTNGFTSTATNRWIGGYSPLNNVSIYPNQHPDHHALVFYPSDPNRAVSATDGGLHYTGNILANNAGTLPVLWTSLNNGYLTTQPYTVSIVPGGTGDQLIAGFQDNGTWSTSASSLTTPWGEEFGGDGSYNAFADGGLTRYVSSQRGNIYRLNYADANAPAGDYVSFTRITPTGATGFAFIAPFALDPNNDNIMYLPAGRTIWRNDNLDGIPVFSNATTTVNWTNITNSTVPAGQTITALGISRMPANRVYFGTNGGQVYRMDNANIGNPTSTNISAGKGMPTGNVICITVDPANANRVFVVFSNYNILSVFYSENGGDTFTPISGNLEQNPDGTGNGPSVRWLAVEGNSDRYYVGTSTGLYSTTALAGMSTVWTQEDVNGIGNVVVPMVKTREDGFVAVATHGTGLYSARFEVSPLPEPTLRIINPIDDFEVYVNSPNTILDISPVFEDTNGDAITYSLINTNPGLVTATLNNNLLVLSYAAGATGKATIGIVATAGAESISEAFTITVRDLEYVLQNQLLTPTLNRPSQLFTDFGNALAQSADDFTIPAGQIWNIEKVYAPGVANGAPVLNAARVVIYADDAGRPGTEVYNSGVVVPASGTANTNLELVLTTPASLSAGKYWLSVYVQLAFAGSNQWFWSASNTVQGSQAHFRDPSNLFGRGAINWTPIGTAFGTVPLDMIFILFGKGTGIPAPAAPSDLQVLYQSNTDFRLSWTDNANDEIGFLIERSTNGTSFTPRATVGPNVTAYHDTDFFDRELTYYYRVAAIGISDTSAYSNVDETAIPPDVPKAKPATLVFPTFFVANWETAVGAKHYELDVYNEARQFLPGFQAKKVTGTSFVVTNTKPNQQYYYVVRAVNAGGKSANSNEMIVTPVKNLKLMAACSSDPKTIKRWMITNPNPFEVEVEWNLFNTTQRGTIVAPPGDTFFTSTTVKGTNTMIIVWTDDKYIPHLVVKNANNGKCSGSEAAFARADYSEDGLDSDSPFIVSVYPNPSRDKFNIMIASPFDGEVEMEIFTLKGDRIHFSKPMSNTVVEIDAHAYPAGNYILKAKQMMYNKSLKLIKQ